MKHDPKLMKAKADKMLKSGALSEKEHKKLSGKADAELARMKASKPDALSAKSKDDDSDAATDKEVGKDTSKADDPAGKFRKRGSDRVTRGEPLDEEEKDD